MSYMWQMNKDGKAKATIQSTIRRLNRLAREGNINEPEIAKEILAKLKWKNKTKRTVTYMLSGYYKYTKQQWTPPNYKAEENFPFIPLESELDTLISAGHKRMSTLLQTLKETGIRIGEATILKWTDLDTEKRTLYITPEKGSNARILPISTKLIGMFNNIPKTSKTIFATDTKNLREVLNQIKKRTATNLNNPRLLQIHFHTFRHWKGTMEYHKTQSIMHVKKILGHKTVTSTEIYINLEQALFREETDEYTCQIATNANEAKPLIENGFQYTTTTPDGLMLFRKRK